MSVTLSFITPFSLTVRRKLLFLFHLIISTPSRSIIRIENQIVFFVPLRERRFDSSRKRVHEHLCKFVCVQRCSAGPETRYARAYHEHAKFRAFAFDRGEMVEGRRFT